MIPNIGPRGRERRVTFGLISLAGALLVAIALIASGAPRGWRSLLFVPLWLAGLGIFQARART